MRHAPGLRRLSILCCLLTLPLVAAANGHRIQVRSTALRAGASAFAKVKATLNFNTPVTIVKEVGSFFQIKSPSGDGFVFKTAVVAESAFNKQYTRVGGTTGYSADAATAATKGFAEAEVRYRQDLRKPPRFDLVDQVTGFYVIQKSDDWWTEFRRTGLLGEFAVLSANPRHAGKGGR